jgi:nucleotide-binding universal stress UspA family protein
MLKVLIPVDDSECSGRAIDHVIENMQVANGGIELHLLTVHAPIPYARATAMIGNDKVAQYYEEEGIATLKSACVKLDAAKIPYKQHIIVGDPADVIVRFAREHGIGQIVIGTHGRGKVGKLLLGSVANKVVQLSEVPVLVIK